MAETNGYAYEEEGVYGYETIGRWSPANAKPFFPYQIAVDVR